MRSRSTCAATLLLAGAVVTLGAPPATTTATGPLAVMSDILKALNAGDVATALASCDSPDAPKTRTKLQAAAAGLAHGDVVMHAIGEHVDGDVAIVILRIEPSGHPAEEESPEFIRTPDGWKLAFDSGASTVTPDQQARLQALRASWPHRTLNQPATLPTLQPAPAP